MNSIKQILQFSDKEFELLVFDIYLNWCDIYAKESNVKIQVLLNNLHVSKWFVKELKKLLNEFKIAFKGYKDSNSSTNNKRNYFIIIVIKIYNYYPDTLFREVKHKNKL